MLRPEDRWRFAPKLPYGWMDALIAKLRPLRYPELDGPTLVAYSDHSGSETVWFTPECEARCIDTGGRGGRASSGS